MQLPTKYLKRNALRSMSQNKRLIIGMVFLNLAISWAVTTEWWSLFVIYLLSMPFHLGMLWFYLELYENRKIQEDVSLVYDPATGQMTMPEHLKHTRLRLSFILKPFQHGLRFYFKVVGIAFFVALFTILWGLLLIVPGIIKSISYSQAFYVLKSKPHLSIFETIRESQRLMEGNKGKYVLLWWRLVDWIVIPIILLALFRIREAISHQLFNPLMALFSLQERISTLIGLLFGEMFLLLSYLGNPDFISSPFTQLLNGNLFEAILSFLFLIYAAFFYFPYFWTVMGGFYHELIGDEGEEPVYPKSSPWLPRLAVVLTTGLVLFGFSGAENVNVDLMVGGLRINLNRRETGLFVHDVTLLAVEDDAIIFNILPWDWQSETLERTVAVTDDVQIIIYDHDFWGMTLFDDLLPWGIMATHREVDDITVSMAEERAQQWVEQQLILGTATKGTFADLEIGDWVTVIGTHNGSSTNFDMIAGIDIGETIEADFLIISKNLHWNTWNTSETITFLGYQGVEIFSDWYSFISFPDAVLEPEQLHDNLLLEWFAENRNIFYVHGWIELNFVNGHQLTAAPYFWQYLIDGFTMYTASFEDGQMIWHDFQTWEVVPSPLTRDTSTSIPLQSTWELTPVPNFLTVSEYIEWAESLDWELIIMVYHPNGGAIPARELGEGYIVSHVFGSYVGSGDTVVWIEVEFAPEHKEGLSRIVDIFEDLALAHLYSAQRGYWDIYRFVPLGSLLNFSLNDFPQLERLTFQ